MNLEIHDVTRIDISERKLVTDRKEPFFVTTIKLVRQNDKGSLEKVEVKAFSEESLNLDNSELWK